MQTTAIKLLLALACLLSATADVSISDVTIGASRVNLLDEEKKTKYIVAVDKDGDAAEPEASPDHRTVIMADKYGRKHSCSVPPAEGASNSKSADAQAAIIDKRTPTELLEKLGDHCLSREDDWWTYEICFRASVRQFHNEPDAEGVVRLASEYILGTYNDSASHLDTVKVDVGVGDLKEKYVSQVYDNGEACDITGQLRQTEVRFVCSAAGEEKIRSIQETTTCKYVAVLETHRLCGLPGFRTEVQPATHILCRILPGQPPAPSEQETELAGDGAVAGLAADGESSSLGQGTLGADGGAQQDANRHPDSAQRSGDQSSEFDVSQVDSDSADSTEEYLDEDDSNEGDILEANVVDEEAEAAEEADVQDAGSEAAIEAAEAAHQGAFRIAHDEL
mmetsp:Transcript_13422/g.40598  ORF Transcript_13422/g.40598 Transcript_13422/m.40598 type:complete len:393 (-) Transcript_13422:203-1381(-)